MTLSSNINITLDQSKQSNYNRLSENNFKLYLLDNGGIVIDDRLQQNPKLRLLGIIPYQLLGEELWTTPIVVANEWKLSFCNTHNKCIIDLKFIITKLILHNIKNTELITVQNIQCITLHLEQNGFHLSLLHSTKDYGMLFLECNLTKNITQTLYKIHSFDMEVSYHINTSFPNGAFILGQCVSGTIQKPKSQTFKNKPLTTDIINDLKLYSKQYVNYSYAFDSSLDHKNEFEIRWNNDKQQLIKKNSIGICTTAAFGFPRFLSIWIYHHLFNLKHLDIIDHIFIYVNYQSIDNEYKLLLKDLNQNEYIRNKISFLNWTITNHLIDSEYGFYEFQELAYIHCLYTNMYKYKWLLYLDTDDFLIILNEYEFINYIQTMNDDVLSNSIQLPWVGYKYCCLYEYLQMVSDNRIFNESNSTLCQLSNTPYEYMKYMLKPTYVVESFIHWVGISINDSKSTKSRGKKIVFIKHMKCHKWWKDVRRIRLNSFEKQCREDLEEPTYLLNVNRKYSENNFHLLNSSKYKNICQTMFGGDVFKWGSRFMC